MSDVNQCKQLYYIYYKPNIYSKFKTKKTNKMSVKFLKKTIFSKILTIAKYWPNNHPDWYIGLSLLHNKPQKSFKPTTQQKI